MADKPGRGDGGFISGDGFVQKELRQALDEVGLGRTEVAAACP
jgi:hypothetical protein